MAIPSGEIYLLKNIPLSMTYQHTIDFENENEQFNFFIGYKKFTQSEYTYIRREREYIAVGLPLKDLDDINYLIFRSANGERLYYAFVTDKLYVNNNLTNLFFKIDVLQTYQFEYKWNDSYIKQSHVDRWTAEHKPIYSKTDEGLAYGDEYSIESAFKIEQSENLRWLLVSMVDYSELAGSGAVVEATSTEVVSSPFACLLVPIIINPALTNLETGLASVRIGPIEVGTYTDLCKVMLNSALGNYIKSISVLTYNPYVISESVDGTNITVNLGDITGGIIQFGDSNKGFYVISKETRSIEKDGRLLARADWDIGLENSLPTEEQWNEIKQNPYTTPRDKRFESKLLCAPYRYTMLTDWRNNPVIFKNEYLTTNKIEVKYNSALSYNAPFRFWIKDYKKDPEGRYTSLIQPLSLEMPIISDQYYTYMLENKNTIQANLTNAIISGVTTSVSGGVSGAMSGAMTGAIGGPVGMVAGGVIGAVSGGISGALNIQSHIRSENAKQADLKAKPDSIINSTDSAFNIMDSNAVLTLYRMRICCENEEIISQIFAMSGYVVNKVEKPNTRSRTRYNYIQTVGANIVGSFNQEHLTEIKAIYDNGLTIWHYHRDHFNYLDYSYENIEVNLI